MLKTILFLLFSLVTITHDFHITHTTLYYNSNLETIEITIKVSVEELEKSLDNKNSENLRIGTEKELASVNEKITNYFHNKLKVYINDELSDYKWVGKEIDNNLHDIYLYFEIPNCNQNGNIESITLTNTIFLEREQNQTNIVLIEFYDRKFNLTFSKDYETQRIPIDK